MVHLQMNGFIADNLFQYAVARIVAEELGYALQVSHSRMHPGKNVPRLLHLLSQCRDAPLALPGKTFHQPLDTTAQVGQGGFDGYNLDLPQLLSRRDNRKILMAGYFQRYELLQPYKDRIRAWFATEPCHLGYDITPDDIVIHVRQGDFVVFGLALSLSYYTRLLDGLDFRQLFICGYGIDAEVKSVFSRYNPIYVQGEPLDDFRFMQGFNRMIQSSSGFSWWSGFLSRASEIHAPVMVPDPHRIDLKASLADLRVFDETRYHYVYDVPYLERPYTLKDIVAARGQLRKKRVLSSLQQLVSNRWGRKNP